MPILVTFCPRCGAQNMTFDIRDAYYIEPELTDEDRIMAVQTVMDCADLESDGVFIDPSEIPILRDVYEAFCICRNPKCQKSTVFVVKATATPSADNARHVEVIDYISQKHYSPHRAPEHLPANIKSAFEEGETCLAVGGLNAACTMFRLCLDLTVRDEFEKLSSDERAKVPNCAKEGSLEKKLNWLFDNSKIPANFRELADCIRNYGNDGAHQGNLRKKDKPDVENLLDFTRQILEDLYTRRKNAALATERRKKRRSKKSGA